MTTSAPLASSLSASFAVIPRQAAAFSPVTMQKSASSSRRSDGSRDSIARRPGAPNTSATNRMFKCETLLAQRERRRGMNLEHDVVPGVGRVARECLVLCAREVDDRSKLGACGGDRRADDE